ncbi:alpha/beta fold hydrolase [Jannaschia seohaensis]|uniref:Pimeloyl-ACP methyl ester carboxylesterase n=1 Tax=Jannaschia seohaensis TaxID=475081 RepID=A0A2Y9AJX7_9RHOB|nr:alpha/beta hydrolase [Jannaschia seohaensis]PWJ20534.1 pimeloyl-ACP methyl ester carboxylesterase [Jannaschia seohaensis]SSA44630.1 Pimeloyl-ACP methyl ester carboxylesterase [Jannaschia seohaensis]
MTPLVLVHGFLGGAAQWAGQVGRLGRDTVTLDLPGFGARADEAPLDRIEAYADWVIAEITRLGVDRYDLLGHSMGGMIVQEVARRDRARVGRLVLYATGAQGLLPGRFETIAESKRRAEEDGAGPTARRIAATWFRDREAAPAYPACAAIAEQAGLPAIHAGLDAMEAWSGGDLLSEIAADTLILWGDRDRTYQWPQIKRLWTGIPRTRLAVVPDAAHAVHLEKPELFDALLRDFLGPG